MSLAHRAFSLMVALAAALWVPVVASAARDLGRSGPHAQHRRDFVPAQEGPREPRSLAPKAGVAMQRPVAPSPATPPEGSRSLAPKKGVAFPRPVAPVGAGSIEMPRAAD